MNNVREVRMLNPERIHAIEMIAMGISRASGQLKRSLGSVALVIAAAAPLYVAGYHTGSISVTGLAIVAGLGPFVMIAVTGIMTGATGSDIVRTSNGLIRRFPEAIAVAIGSALLILAANALYAKAMAGVVPAEVAMIATNQYGHWLKPIAQMAAFACLFLAICPSMMVAIPASLRSRCELEVAYWSTRHLHQNKTFGKWQVFGVFVGAALFTQVSVAGLVVLPIAAAIGAAISDRVFRAA